MKRIALAALLLSQVGEAFVSPNNNVLRQTTTTTNMMPEVADVLSSSSMMMDQNTIAAATTSMMMPSSAVVDQSLSSSALLSFADQGQNLAGIFFQSSLLPYLLYLYFISFRGNRIPSLSNFGLQFVLLFVASTIPSGIISKSTYGVTLANCDWLHGGAELLLTVANVLLVLGFKEAYAGNGTPDNNTDDGESNNNTLNIGRAVALGAFATFVGACVVGPAIFEAHTPFLAGIGDLGSGYVDLPFVTHSDPENALSIPTWMIHYSSVLEFIVAMKLVWDYAEATGNEKWKGLTWGMLPLHASGICACTYHLFYNNMQFLVTMQAGFTALGNLTCAIAAYRIAVSNGWTFQEVNPFQPSETSPRGLVVDQTAAMPLVLSEDKEAIEPIVATFGKIVAGTVVLSYLTKYGELGVDTFFTPNGPLALGIVLGIPAVTAGYYFNQGGSLNLPSLPGMSSGEDGGEGLSMADVKKYGISGTVAYVLTELAFWAVAFPVASTALYQTTGHWPDVLNDTADRATVLGFIFAGANVARLLVPLRLGAALALAPWVDENLLSKFQKEEN